MKRKWDPSGSQWATCASGPVGPKQKGLSATCRGFGVEAMGGTMLSGAKSLRKAEGNIPVCSPWHTHTATTHPPHPTPPTPSHITTRIGELDNLG